MAAQIGAIQDQEHGIRLWDARHVSGQHITGDLLVLRPGVQAVDAGKIHQDHVVMVLHRSLVRHLGSAYALFHRNAGEVRDLLAQAGQAIKKRRLARIGRPNDGDDMRTQAFVQGRRVRHCRGNRTAVATVAIAHILETFPLDGRRISRDAVSRRSATSEPSTR